MPIFLKNHCLWVAVCRKLGLVLCAAFVCVILSSEPAADKWQAEPNGASLSLLAGLVS